MDELKVVAQYVAVSDYWTDIPEAQPRSRVKVPEGSETKPVAVLEDGTLQFEGDVQVDTTYEGR